MNTHLEHSHHKMYTLIIIHQGTDLFWTVLDSLSQFWTVKDGLNLVLDTVRPKPSFGRPKPNPDY